MGKKILIVDDDPAIAALYSTRLTSSGYEVVTAGNGNEGMEKVKSERPDLLILDVLMPGMSGYEFLQFLRKCDDERKNVPVIVVSARQSMRDFFPNWEIHTFLVKPFEPVDLMNSIASALGQEPVQEQPSLAAKTSPSAPPSPAPAPPPRPSSQAPAPSFAPSAAPSKKLTGKKVLLAGIEEFVMNKAKSALQAAGATVTMSYEEKKALETARAEKPDFIFVQFWEDSDKFDAQNLVMKLQGAPELKGTNCAVFCSNRNGLEASKLIKEVPFVLFQDSAELSREILKYIED